MSALRRQLEADAGDRCGYCQSSVGVTGTPLVIDHLVPQAAGGPTRRANLWLACHRCNQFKGARQDAVDPVTRVRASFFNPRRQRWQDHFTWSDDGTRIIGITPTGRATVIALRLNNREIVAARRRWVEVGWHPPVLLRNR
jgi:hypothetical protein